MAVRKAILKYVADIPWLECYPRKLSGASVRVYAKLVSQTYWGPKEMA